MIYTQSSIGTAEDTAIVLILILLILLLFYQIPNLINYRHVTQNFRSYTIPITLTLKKLSRYIRVQLCDTILIMDHIRDHIREYDP